MKRLEDTKKLRGDLDNLLEKDDKEKRRLEQKIHAIDDELGRLYEDLNYFESKDFRSPEDNDLCFKIRGRIDVLELDFGALLRDRWNIETRMEESFHEILFLEKRIEQLEQLAVTQPIGGDND